MANSKNITFDQLQAALSRVKSALDGKANTSHGNHVPKTETANNARFLRNDNTWQTITPVNIGAADRSHSHGSYVNQNAFTNIKVGDTTVAADSPTDTLTLTAGANVTLTPDATNDTVTIAAKDTVYTHPTTSGYKHIPSGGSSGQILRWSADGTAVWGSDNNTDTKVTNTLNTTAKAYVTGTTSATTNTGTQVFDTGVYLDTTAGKLVASSFAGSLSGNASSATKLQTARAIKIGNTSKNFDGTANVTWTLSEIGAAASNHNHGLLHSNLTVAVANTTTDNGWSMINSSYNGYILKSIRSNANAPAWLQGNYSAGIAFGGEDTKGVMSVAYNAPSIRFAGGNGTKPVWNMTLTGTSGKSYNMDSLAANTANTLAVARTINGTSFNGSRNITTANWGTARTLTIGSTGKSVNGSGNVSWSLSEIGAKTRIKKVIDLSNTKTYSVDKWYPCLAGIPYDGMHDIEVAVQLKSGVKPSWATHNSGFTCNLHIKALAGGWGTTSSDSIVLNHTYGFASANPCSYSQLNNSSNAVLWLRGGGKYFVFTDWDASWSVKTASTTINEQTVAPVTSCPNISLAKSTIIANLNGNAGTATKLQTTRSINGTNFDGSGNITTANWGTARTLTVGNTGKSVNGSSNVSWSLAEIGAAASNHSHSYLPLSGGTMTGNITFSDVNSTSYPANSSKITWNGSTDGADIYYRVTASDKGQLVLNLRDDADATIGIALNGTVKTTFDTNGYYSGKANQANTLATARTINGTSFNGSANITTANWGTARTITIGSTGKSVNGGGNVTWTWNEMGVPKSQGNYRFGGNANGITTAQFITLITNAGAFNQFYWISRGTWDYAGNQYINDTGCGNIHLAGCTVECIGTSSSYTIRIHTPTTSNKGVTYGDFIYVNNGKDYSPGWRRLYSNKYKPTPADIGAAASNHGHNYAGSSSAGGNANAAVKLATARSINGTNFDGSGNITTANWGTARTITIGGKGKSVNGSGNVSWSLSEIGALPTAGGTVSGNLNVTGAFSIGGKKITINSSAPSNPAVGDIWIKI